MRGSILETVPLAGLPDVIIRGVLYTTVNKHSDSTFTLVLNFKLGNIEYIVLCIFLYHAATKYIFIQV